MAFGPRSAHGDDQLALSRGTLLPTDAEQPPSKRRRREGDESGKPSRPRNKAPDAVATTPETETTANE